MKTLSSTLKFFLLVFLSAISILSLNGCHQERSARKITPSMSSYVYAYTSGTISKTSPIRVRFTSTLAGADQIGNAVGGGILSFQPAIAGQAIWEDDRTIRFEPEEPLKSNTTFVGSVKLERLFKSVPQDAKVFEFEFRTRELYFDVDVEGIQPVNNNDLTRQQLIGTIITSDVVEEEKVEKLLSAVQDGQTLPVTWSHNKELTEHHFLVDKVARTDQEKSVKLSWDGGVIGIRKKGDETVAIPALGDFKVMDAKIVQEQDQFIKLHFSDPILSSQELHGLITISDYYGDYRYMIDGNIVLVYPTYRIGGERMLNALPGIKNINGQAMKAPSSWKLEFADIKPQVRLVGKGVIMPNSDKLNFPFEAINLNYVEVEILKIYNNNILQFLQTNDLDGNDELQRVGRIVLQKKVTLKDLNPNATTQDWTRYALDLSKLIKADPSAIYQVRIGFRPGYSNYACGKTGNNPDNLEIVKDAPSEDEDIKSIWDDYYGIDGYYEGFRWEQKDDPCFPAYYNYDHFIRRNVFVSDLGIVTKKGKDNSLMVAVSDLKTTAPKSGVKLDFYDFQNQLLGSTSTNGEGIGNILVKRNPYLVVASQGNQKGYLALSDGKSLSLSRFDVAGVEPQKGLKGYLYGERGVWRPGDSLYLNFVLEDKTGKLPPNHPVTLELYDPRGQLQYRLTSTENVKNVYPFHLATSENAPTGFWKALVKSGGATFTNSIRIETIKPNRLKINLDFGKKELESSDKSLTGKMDVAWLHGAPARNLKARVEVQLEKTTTKFAKYNDFVFDDPGRVFSSEPATVFDGNLDDNGHANIKADLSVSNTAPGKLKANFRTRAFEPGGDFSSDFFSMDYSPFTSYAGLSIPENKYGEKRIDLGKDGKISFLAVDEKGNPLRGKTLNVVMYRVEWRWWWDSDQEEGSQFNNSSSLQSQVTATLKTNGQGMADWSVKVDDWGRYFVRVCDAESGHCSGDFFYAGYPWNDDNQENRNAAAMLMFTSNKEKYKVGESIELTIPTGEAGKALISLETGTKVIATYWMNAKAGENKFKFQATAEMSPTVYANVTLIQPHGQVKNDLPIRLYGVVPLQVEDPKTRLAPVLKMPDQLAPEQTFSVEVSETNGKPMAYTLAIVDEGLLDLTRFKTPDPWSSFYAREALGVTTWDLYDQVLGAYGAQLERILSIGGDGTNRTPKNASKANRFKPVVRHLGPFFLAAGQKAKHQIKLPNYIGSVRTMLVASNNGSYGSTEKTTPVKKPLMILATLPRVLGPGEKLKLPVDVFAMDAKIKNVEISVQESSGLVKILGGATKNLNFAKPGDGVADFEIQVAENVGIGKFKITAKGGGEVASQEIEIDVRNPNPYATNIQDGIMEAGKDWTVDFTPAGMYGTNKGILEVSSIPPINLGSRLLYLIQYPHGCIEQTTSAGFPQLYVEKLMILNPTQKKQIPENIRATLNRLKQFQTPSGGFGYWPGDDAASYWGTNYAGHFMLEAKTLGYEIPGNILERWIKFQQKIAKRWDPELDDNEGFGVGESELNQAYRLYTLALAKSADLGSMNRLMERPKLSVQARWRLAAAYAISGKPEIARKLTTGIATSVKKYRELAYTYGSDTRDQAMILETLVLMGDKTQAASLSRNVSEVLSSNEWLSTQETAYSLLAIGKLVGDSKVDSKFTFSYQLGGGQLVNAGSTTPVFQIDIPVDKTKSRSIVLKNTGKNKLFVRLITSGQPAVGQQTAVANNLNIVVNYKTLKGEPLNPAVLKQGTDFIAEVVVTNPGTLGMYYREMVLSQIFPSGWEIHNARMDNIAGYLNSSVPEYQDLRDDRIYTYFDIGQHTQQVYRVQLNAAYEGKYYLPGVSCEAMYNKSISARKPGMWVEVVGGKENPI